MKNEKIILFESSGYFEAIGDTGGGYQSIKTIYTNNAKIWLELRHAYDIAISKEEGKKLIEILSKGVNILEQKS